MMIMCKFSVIISLYNKAPYIRKALESVVAQSYRDFELIVINDGSSDNSLKVVKNFVDEFKIYDLRFKILDQPNAGVAVARNNGVAASHGEFICFLDADDWWEPNFLEEIDRLIAEYPDAGLYATNYVYYKPGKTRVALNLPRGYMNYPEAYLHSDMMPVTSITTCMPRKVFNEMGGFPAGIKLGEDFLLWAKTAVHYKVAYCEKALAYYNNDIPANLRATRNLHAPEHNMLFNLTSLEDEIEHSAISNQQSDLWKILLDKLRVSGLLEYWLSDEYHSVAAEELEKVDWARQSKFQIRIYKTPIWIQKAKKTIMRIGSFFKQQIVRMCKV